MCPECCVAQERLSQSMAGSLGSACVLDGCPIRRASTMNCVLLTRKDNTGGGVFGLALAGGNVAQSELNSEGRLFLASKELTASADRLDPLPLEA